jgi:hypothetical protein
MLKAPKGAFLVYETFLKNIKVSKTTLMMLKAPKGAF